MQDKRVVMMRSRLSVAVYLQDSYTSQPPLSTSNVRVELEGTYKKPIRKSNGCCIFTDLEEGIYSLIISSRDYIDDIKQIVVDLKQSIIHISLVPKPSYPFLAGSTLIRGMLRDERDRPIIGAQVTAYVQSEDCIKAKLAADATEGSTEVNLVQVTGKLNIGDRFLISGLNLIHNELCVISEVKENKRGCTLEQGMQFLQLRGAAFMPVIYSVSSERGEIAIPFPNYRTRTFLVKLEIASDSQLISLEVQVDEGSTSNLGIVRV